MDQPSSMQQAKATSIAAQSAVQGQSNVIRGSNQIPPRATSRSSQVIYSPAAAQSQSHRFQLDEIGGGPLGGTLVAHHQALMPGTPANPPQLGLGLSGVNRSMMNATQHVITVPSQRNMAINNNFLQTTGTMTSVRSRTPMAPASKLSKQDFEMGFLVTSKGDRELVYVARKKTVQTADTADATIPDSDTISQATSTLPAGGTYLAPLIATIREVAKRRLDGAQIKQLKESATFLSQNHQQENLLRVWDIFWDDKKVYFVHEPAIRTAQLVPLQTDSENISRSIEESPADFIKKFEWQETIIENREIIYLDQSIEKRHLRQKQDYLRKQLHNKVTQMIDLYKHLLDVHCLTNVHIKPQNILESSTSSLKVYHVDTTTKVLKPANNMDGLILNPKESAPGRVDLQDLAMFIFFLCTRERLFEEKNDFDEGIVKSQIKSFLLALKSKEGESRPGRNQLGSVSEKAVQKFKQLPIEFQKLMRVLLDYDEQARYESWVKIQLQVELLLNY